jgi:hypothetical protein
VSVELDACAVPLLFDPNTMPKRRKNSFLVAPETKYSLRSPFLQYNISEVYNVPIRLVVNHNLYVRIKVHGSTGQSNRETEGSERPDVVPNLKPQESDGAEEMQK